MIELHCIPDDPFSNELKEWLNDLVVAHKVLEYSDRDLKAARPEYDLPYIRENGTIVTGHEKIRQFMKQLSIEIGQQRMVTGDGCYIDPETGEVC